MFEGMINGTDSKFLIPQREYQKRGIIFLLNFHNHAIFNNDGKVSFDLIGKKFGENFLNQPVEIGQCEIDFSLKETCIFLIINKEFCYVYCPNLSTEAEIREINQNDSNGFLQDSDLFLTLSEYLIKNIFE